MERREAIEQLIKEKRQRKEWCLQDKAMLDARHEDPEARAEARRVAEDISDLNQDIALLEKKLAQLIEPNIPDEGAPVFPVQPH